MALQLERSTQFKRDYKRIKRQRADLIKLLEVISLLAAEEALAPHYLDHPLKGNWRGYRECHIQPDWLLIYQIEGDTLRLSRTGSHSELFG
ncbi:MAG: type II toxin-antitoxin system YafQ family toxin [Caldilineaceae bacterium]